MAAPGSLRELGKASQPVAELRLRAEASRSHPGGLVITLAATNARLGSERARQGRRKEPVLEPFGAPAGSVPLPVQPSSCCIVQTPG